MRRFIISILLFCIGTLHAANYQVNSPADLEKALSKMKPGDEIEISEGTFQPTRIYRIEKSGTEEKPIIIRGAGIRKTIILTKNAYAFRVFGDHIIFRDLTFDGKGGGFPFTANGNHITAEWCSFENAAIGMKISGDHFRGSHLLILSNEKSGIEVNGGYVYRKGWANNSIRIKQAVGELEGREDERNKWSSEQLEELDALWERREMDCRLDHIFFVENGLNRSTKNPDGSKWAQAMYGGQIKAVPHVSGLYLEKCIAIKGQFSNYWIDFPSKGKNEFRELWAFGGQHGAHIEGGYEDGHETIIENCVFWDVHQGIFNSASSSNIYKNNLIGSYRYGIVNHGIKGNRIDRKTIATYENNEIYMFPSKVMRVGTTTQEDPKGHMVWFSGQNAEGSKRINNTYYLTPDFPELKIGLSSKKGYSFGPSNLGDLHSTEQTKTVNELPEITLPSWSNELPLFEVYFDYNGADQCDDCPDPDPDPDPKTPPSSAETKSFLINLADLIMDFANKF